jgi:hypothetical protein
VGWSQRADAFAFGTRFSHAARDWHIRGVAGGVGDRGSPEDTTVQWVGTSTAADAIDLNAAFNQSCNQLIADAAARDELCVSPSRPLEPSSMCKLIRIANDLAFPSLDWSAALH